MEDIRTYLNRRTFLRRGAAGLGSIALASLLDPALFAQPAAAAPAKPGKDQLVRHPAITAVLGAGQLLDRGALGAG